MPNILMRRWMIAIIAAIAVGCGASPEPPPETQSPAPTVSSTLPPTLAYTPTFAPTEPPRPTREPLPTYTPRPYITIGQNPLKDPVPTMYVGPVPNGAVQVLGLGQVGIDLSPHGDYYAITDWFGARVYDLDTLEPLWPASKAGNQITWMENGDQVAVNSILYAIEDGSPVMSANPATPLYLWSPDAQTIASDKEGQIILQDARTNTVIARIISPEEEDIRQRLCANDSVCRQEATLYAEFSFDPTGMYLIVQVIGYYAEGGSDDIRVESDNYARIYDSRSGNLLGQIENADTRRAFLITWDPHRPTVAINDSPHALPSGEPVAVHPSYFVHMPRQPDYGYLPKEYETDTYFIALDDNLDFVTFRPLADLAQIPAYYANSKGAGMRWSADGTRIQANMWGTTAFAWDISTGMAVETVGRMPNPRAGSRWEDRAADGRLASIDPSRLLVDGIPIAELGVVNTQMYPAALKWSPDGRRIAVSYTDYVDIYDSSTGILVTRTARAPYLAERYTMDALAWSPDSTHISGATRYSEGYTGGPGSSSIIVWDAETGDIIDGWVAHEGGADEVAFSPDGSLLASRGRGGEIIVWEVP